MKLTRLFCLLVVAIAVAALPAAADILQFDLSVANSGLNGTTGPYASVTINRTDTTHALVTVTGLSNYTLGSNGAFGLNLSNTNVTASGISWTGGNSGTHFTAMGAQNLDGFGTFNFSFDDFDGRNSSVGSLSFNLTLTSGSWSSAISILTNNSNGYFAAGHAFAPGLTGYAANGAPPTVPEPASMLLLAAGGLSLLGLGRIRK
jgi:PEP-CTERM motif